MKKYFLKIILVMVFFSSAEAQWNLKSNNDDGKYSLITNSANFFGVSSGSISTETVLMLSSSDTASWRLVTNTDNGLYSLAENKVSFMGIDSGKVRTKAIYVLNPSTLLSLGLDTTRIPYLGKSNSFAGRKQNFDTVNASVKYLLNGADINTAGTLSNVLYLNQNAAVTGRYTFNDLTNFQDSVQIGSAYLYYQNGKVTSTKSVAADTLSGNFFTAGAYMIGSTRIIFTGSNNLNINSATTRDLLLGTGTAGSVWTFQSALGNVVYAPLTVTGSMSTGTVMDIAQTWNAGSNVLTGIKYNVTNTASSSSSLLFDYQVNSGSILSLSRTGTLTLTGASGFTPTLSFGNASITNSSAVLLFTSAGQGIMNAYSFTLAQNQNAISGNQNFLNNIYNFSPSSGTATSTGINLTPTINQTGGANGITRGMYINPVLTSASDWRAIEVASGKSIFQDVIVNNDSKGIVLKDSTGHYWRVTVNTSGVLSTTDLGTSLTGF
jgi:hypothetical protein